MLSKTDNDLNVLEYRKGTFTLYGREMSSYMKWNWYGMTKNNPASFMPNTAELAHEEPVCLYVSNESCGL
jgi:hypothetical protein